MKRSILFLVGLSLIIGACGATTDADGTPTPLDTTPSDGANASAPALTADGEQLAPRPTGTDTKLESNLYQALLLAEGGMSVEEITVRTPVLRFDEDEVLVEVTLGEMTEETVAAAAAAGLTISDEYPELRMLAGSVAIGSLQDLAALSAVESIVPQFGAATG